MSSNINEIEKILRKGLFSLSESLYQHLPLPDGDNENEISEGNLVIHIAHEYIVSGYNVFSEYRISKNKHLDLKMIAPDKSHEIVVECKRYFKIDTSGCLPDLKRMQTLKNDRKLYSVVVLFTRNKEIHDWWIDSNRVEYPTKKHYSNEWGSIYHFLKDADVMCSSFPMSYHGRDDFYHMCLYGIFENRP